jgi:hypothetical protein
LVEVTSAGPMRLAAAFPATGDAPSFGPGELPRVPGGRRVLAAQAGGVALWSYEHANGAQDLDALQALYLATLNDAGLQPAGPIDATPADRSQMFWSREGSTLLRLTRSAEVSTAVLIRSR